MKNFNWVLSTLLVTALISSLSTGSTQTTKAQTTPSSSFEDGFGTLTKDNQPPGDPKPPVERRTGTSRGGNPWVAIFQSIPKDNDPPPPPRTGAPRGPVCAIAPKSIGSSTEIWSDHPLFVWKVPGTVKINRLDVRPVGSTQVLWRANVKESATQIQKGDTYSVYSVLYNGEALQPGQTYEWRLFMSDREDVRPIKTETFQVMNSQKRDRITEQLQSLDEQLKANNALPEDMARRRAQYFAKEQLWSDVLQEAYRVENPSPALVKFHQDISVQICTPPQRNSNQPR